MLKRNLILSHQKLDIFRIYCQFSEFTFNFQGQLLPNIPENDFLFRISNKKNKSLISDIFNYYLSQEVLFIINMPNFYGLCIKMCFKKPFVYVHLDMKIYWNLPDTLWNSIIVTTIFGLWIIKSIFIFHFR